MFCEGKSLLLLGIEITWLYNEFKITDQKYDHMFLQLQGTQQRFKCLGTIYQPSQRPIIS